MRFILTVSLFLVSPWLMAETPSKQAIASLSKEPIGVGNYLQMFFGLLIVVGLIIGMAWFMRRMGKMSGISNANLRVVGGISIGQRERIVLVQAGEQQLLVGVAPGTIRTLHVLEEKIDTAATSSTQGGMSGFADKLQAAMKKRGQS